MNELTVRVVSQRDGQVGRAGRRFAAHGAAELGDRAVALLLDGGDAAPIPAEARIQGHLAVDMASAAAAHWPAGTELRVAVPLGSRRVIAGRAVADRTARPDTAAGRPMPRVEGATGRTLRLAHRGDHRSAPENTLAAFRTALAVPGCDGLELDVRASRDGVPVVIHDETLDRVQGRRLRVDGLTADELEDLAVPSLASVLAAVPRAAFLDVELKEDLGRSVVEVLSAARGPDLHRAVVSSFEVSALRSIAHLAAAWPTWLNADDMSSTTLERAERLGCSGVAATWQAVDARSVAAAAARGLAVAAWTVRRRATRDRLVRLGVLAVCVEGPALES